MPHIPAVAFIEAALEQLRAADPDVLRRELKELHMMGLRLKHPLTSINPTNIELGYLLGLETARVLLSGMPAAVQAGITL